MWLGGVYVRTIKLLNYSNCKEKKKRDRSVVKKRKRLNSVVEKHKEKNIKSTGI